MVYLQDRAKIEGPARITAEGYLVADALVARANNVQAYSAGELGITDRAPSDQIRVFRPESEVFAVDSVATAVRLPITMDHPREMVDARNWREYTRGETGDDIIRDGEFMRVPLRVTDADAVKSVQDDRQEFSLGYTAEIKMQDGTSPKGEAYDAIASNIRYNHLAACRSARGGTELRIVDERPARQPEGNTMPHIVLVDGMPVDVANPETAATVVKNAIAARDTAQGALEDSQTALATANTTIAARDAEIVALKDAAESGKLTSQQLRDAAASYARTCALAKAVGATFTDAMDEGAVKAAAVVHKMGDAAKDYTPEQFVAAFDALTAGVKPAPVADAADPLRAALVDGTPQAQGDLETKFRDARQARMDRLANGHLNAAKEG